MLPRTPFALVILALVVPGCTGGLGGDEDTATPTGPAASESRFLAPVALGSAGGPEPIVVVGPDGAIWVAAQDAAGGAPRVWYSSDAGASFRESRPSRVGGGEVDLAVGSSSTYVTQLGPGGNVVSYSRDKGQTWSQSAFAGTNYFERELVAVDARGSVYLASRFGLRQLTGQLASDDATVARSDDGGVTFVPGGNIWDADNEPGTTIGNLLSYGSSLGAAYNCRDATGVCFARSGDRGATWTQTLVAQRGVDVANVYPVLAVDGSRLAIAWSDAQDGRLAIWVAESTDNGASWSAPARVSEPDETATLPWIASGGGRTWVVYATTDVDGAEAGAAGMANAQWYARAARLDGLAAVERAPLLDVPVHEGVISKPVGQNANGPFDRSFGDFFTLAVDASGRAYVAVPITTGATTVDYVVVERR